MIYYYTREGAEPVTREEYELAEALDGALFGNTFTHKAVNVPRPGDLTVRLLDPSDVVLAYRQAGRAL